MQTKDHPHLSRRIYFLFVFSSLMLLVTAVGAQAQPPGPPIIEPPVAVDSPTPSCERTIKADVVALDQVIMYNRLGTVNPGGMIYALKDDIVFVDPAKGLVAGNVRLRSDKRPRPIVLRMNNGDCLRVSFTNLLSPTGQFD
jgi:hypothetical protein